MDFAERLGFLFDFFTLLNWGFVGVGASELANEETHILLVGYFAAVEELLFDFLADCFVILVRVGFEALVF